MVKDPLANAGDTALIPGSGRFHVPWGLGAIQLLSLSALEPVLHERSHPNKKPAYGN